MDFSDFQKDFEKLNLFFSKVQITSIYISIVFFEKKHPTIIFEKRSVHWIFSMESVHFRTKYVSPHVFIKKKRLSQDFSVNNWLFSHINIQYHNHQPYQINMKYYWRLIWFDLLIQNMIKYWASLYPKGLSHIPLAFRDK